jgi:hypothetical protein
MSGSFVQKRIETPVGENRLRSYLKNNDLAAACSCGWVETRLESKDDLTGSKAALTERKDDLVESTG